MQNKAKLVIPQVQNKAKLIISDKIESQLLICDATIKDNCDKSIIVTDKESKKQETDFTMNNHQQRMYKLVTERAQNKGWTVISKYFISDATKMNFLCAQGHPRSVTPSDLRNSRDRLLCDECNGRARHLCIQRFHDSIAALGGKVIGEYKGRNIGVHVQCAFGHDCYPCPGSIASGQGMCKICTQTDSKTAEANFHRNVENLGGKVIGSYEGAFAKVECRCSQDHICYPTPANLRNGQGMCRRCTGLLPEMSKERFHDNIKALGGKVIGEYTYSDAPVECECPEGHKCNPYPSNIGRGQGMCLECSQNRVSSKGVENIENYFNERKIKFAREHKLDVAHRYKYDFIINENILIEFDGEQHFRRAKMWCESDEMFAFRQEIDRMKTYLALLSGFVLIRISNKDAEHIKNMLNYCLNQKEKSILYIDDAVKYHYLTDVKLSTDVLLTRSKLEKYIEIDIKAHTRLVTF